MLTAGGSSMTTDGPEPEKPFISIPVRDAEQIRRARVMLATATAATDEHDRFVFWVSALHFARAVPEYWFTTAENIPIDLRMDRKDWKRETTRLREAFAAEFAKARRFNLLSTLRHWDFHWEPLIDSRTIAPNTTYGRGAPLRLSTGKQPGSSVAWFGGKIVATGTGGRVGRANYFQIHQNRYVDPDKPEALPLGLAIEQFLDDLPACIGEIAKLPDVIAYIKATTYVEPEQPDSSDGQAEPL